MKNEEKIAVLKRIFTEDIEQFGRFFFPHHMSKPSPQFHKEIFRLYEGDYDRIAIGAPRGHAKSTITDLVYLAWEIVNNKRHFILLTSDTYSQAVLFLEAVKAEFEANDKLKAFYGDLKTDKWAEGEIIVGETMVKAVGAGMKVRGLKFNQYRPDLIIIDDLENDEAVQSRERREKLERWFNGALVPCLTPEPGKGRIVVIGTILHYDALLYKILGQESYHEYEKRLYRAINDWGPLWEEHLNLKDLDKKKKEYEEKGLLFQFYQEYQNNPISEENRKFKFEHLQYYTEDQIATKSLNTYLTIDRAYSLEKTADSTGIVVVSVDQENNWYVRMAEAFKGTEKEIIEKIFDIRGHFNIQKVGIEQKAFEYTIKPALVDEMRKRNMFFEVEELKDGGKAKVQRIEGLLPRYLAKTIFFKKEHTDIVDQLLTFPRNKHDDLIDSLAYQLDIAEQVFNAPAEEFSLYTQSYA